MSNERNETPVGRALRVAAFVFSWPAVIAVNAAAVALSLATGNNWWMVNVAVLGVGAAFAAWLWRWQATYTDTGWAEDRGGIPWDIADPPPRRHICVAWTRGAHAGDGAVTQRCRCGARRNRPTLGGPSEAWRDRNSRHRGRWRVDPLR